MSKKTLHCRKCDSKLKRPTDVKVSEIVCHNCGFVMKRKGSKKTTSRKRKKGAEGNSSGQAGGKLLITVSGGVLLLLMIVSGFLFFRSDGRDTSTGDAGSMNKGENGREAKPQIKAVTAGAALKYRVNGGNYREWIEKYLDAKKQHNKDDQKVAREALYEIMEKMPADLSVLNELLDYELGDYEELEHVKLYAGTFVRRLVQLHPAEVALRINEIPPELSSRGHTLTLIELAGPKAVLARDYLHGLMDIYPDAHQRILRIMSEIGADAVPFIVELLEDDRFAKNALIFLGRMKLEGKSALPAIQSHWDQFADDSKSNAIFAMVEIAPGDSKAVDLTAGFSSTNMHASVAALLRHGDLGAEQLLKLCADQETLKATLSRMRGSSSSKTVYPSMWPVVKLGLEHEDRKIVVAACLAAQRLENKFEKVVPQLTELLESEFPEVKSTANSILFENLDIKTLSEEVLVTTLIRHAELPEVFDRVFTELRKRGDKVKPFLPQITEAANRIQTAAEKQIEEDKGWFYARFENRDGFPSLSRVRRTTNGAMRVPGELKLQKEISGYSLVEVEEIDSKFQKQAIQGAERLKKLVSEFE